MNDKITEQISALLDDEIEEHEQELLLKRLMQDPELLETFSRYQLIGEAMRGEAHGISIADSVSQQIQEEEAHTQSELGNSIRMTMLKPVAGLAIAASVAAMAIVGIQNMGQNHNPETANALVAQSQSVDNLRRVGTHWNVNQPETEMRLNGYLVNHSEYTSGINLQGMINYARIAGYDSK